MTSKSDADLKSEAIQSRMGKTARFIYRMLNRCIDQSRRELIDMLEKMAYKSGMTRAEAKAWLEHPTNGEVQTHLLNRTRALGNDKLNKSIMDSLASFTYTRRKALTDALENQLLYFSNYYRRGLIPLFTDTSYEAWGRSMYDIQKNSRIAFTLTGFPSKMLDEAVNNQLSYTYSTYTIKSVVGKALHESLFSNILLGKGVKDISKDLVKTKEVVPWKAKAIARTSLTEMANKVEAETIKSAGLKKYRYVATLDERTCPHCGKLDGKIFNLSDKEVGVNFPPLHPNCRCTTTAAFTPAVQKAFQRAVKDAHGDWVYVRGDMTYEEWKKAYLRSKPPKNSKKSD